MSGNDYILIFDEVADMRVRGRFSWFTHRDEDFPGIYQLKPGAAASSVDPGGPVDTAPVPPGGYARPGIRNGYPKGSKGRYDDGFAHFLTVVTHRETWQPQLTEVQTTGYGAIVSLCGRTDYLFRDASRIRHDDGVIRFDGYAGIVRSYSADQVEAAAFAFTLNNGDLRGQSSSAVRLAVELEVPDALADVHYRMYVDGQPLDGGRSEEDGRCVICFELPPGRHSWQWTDHVRYWLFSCLRPAPFCV
ncbi:hypothetical protein [Cohnella fermenti]|uniref:Uncharacterized protein n=1 Tax=Cohnella fermenti TaxID=2565925 RepID=A0A4S4BIG6_9BACL|nr:hypothetical protein [Cohnella fermenti]THF74411.1 hypothetical protein E6C55_25555 [Cohnella fermenti]